MSRSQYGVLRDDKVHISGRRSGYGDAPEFETQHTLVKFNDFEAKKYATKRKGFSEDAQSVKFKMVSDESNVTVK